MRAHAHDLRAEVAGDFGITDEAQGDLFVHRLASDWRRAGLSPADTALCAFAEKLTRNPAAMATADLEELRRHGFDDRALHDAAQIIGVFNHFNRVADALGLEPETFIRPWEQGPQAVS